MSNVIVKIAGEAFTGWLEARVSRSLRSLSGSFELTLTDEQNGRDWRFVTQQECTISLDDQKMLSGFIDSVDFDVSGGTHRVVIRGRDKTADLVDCSVVKDNKGTPFDGTIKNTDLLGITKRLVDPFGIAIRSNVPLGGKFKRFAVQRGETVFEALDRAAKQRGIILQTDEEGRLLLTVSGSERTHDSIKYGSNVLEARGTYDYVNRFSDYRIESQVSNEGGEVGDSWGGTVNVSGVFGDRSVNRFRPIIITAEANTTRGDCKKRAASEALYRAAASQQYEIKVATWSQSNGQLWRINQTSFVDIPPLYVRENLLISDITYSLSLDEGATVILTYMREDAFDTARALDALSIRDPKGTSEGWRAFL